MSPVLSQTPHIFSFTTCQVLYVHYFLEASQQPLRFHREENCILER